MGGQRHAWRTCAAGFGSLLLTASAFAAEAPASTPLFPEHATVVLMTGLPGDMESESTYHEQLQSWLEIASTSAKAASIHVLCDDPASVTLPAGAGGEVTKGDRAHFVGLGQALAKDANRLVVIAWGHGGRQGNTPVFHVRGPRIMAADFQALAGRSAAPESRWILLYPGSGAFAAALAGDKRRVLSSEAETMFGSDPRGMSVLLKLARDKPSLSFDALCEEFGRAVTAWYAERNLARTEEPTLWSGTAKPRLLAGTSESNAFASTPPAPTNAPPKEQRHAEEAASADLPPAWKAITRADPQKYPDADAVVLLRRCTYTLGASPAVVTENEEYIQVLTPEGKRFGDFDVSFSPPYEDISFLDCEVLSPEGKLVRLDPDSIHEGAEPTAGDYHKPSRKFFSLPGVVPGAVLHVRYKTEWKEFPLPHVSLEIPLGQEMPTLDTTIEVGVPQGTPFHFGLEQVAAPDPVIKQTSYGTTYRWHFEALPSQARDILMPPLQGSRLQISTFPDWAAFAEWYARISKLTDEVTPEIAAKATELTRNAKTNHEKVPALYDYVTNLRYVAIPLGVNSFRPHAAANVLQNQFGDCKDKANLLNALLHSQHIDARLVLVPRFSQAHEGLPGLAFNHAISRVMLDGQVLWVDTTDDVCRFGMLPPGDPGRNVLVIDGQTSALTELPAPGPKDHRLTLRGEADCTGAADALPLKLIATALGYPDYELRTAAREIRDHGSSVPLLAARYRPCAGSFALETQKATGVSALDESFAWTAEGSWVGGCSANGSARSLRSPFWLPKEWEAALHHRTSGLFLNQGYPLTLDEEVVFRLPPKGQLGSLPAAREGRTDPLQWRIEWATIGQDKLVAKLHSELRRGECPASETPGVQQQFRALLSAVAATASFTAAP